MADGLIFSKKKHCSIMSVALFIFLARTTNTAKRCARQSRGIPPKFTYPTLYALYFSLKLINYLFISASDNKKASKF